MYILCRSAYAETIKSGFFFFPCPVLFICLSLPQHGSGIHFSWALIFSEPSYILCARKPKLLHFERRDVARTSVSEQSGARSYIFLSPFFFLSLFCRCCSRADNK